MPYKDISELPESVRNALPEEAQKLFLEVVNSALKQYDGDEAKAFATAWSAVKKQYSKQGDTWVKQAELGVSGKVKELRFNFSSGKFQELDGGLLIKDVKLLANGTWRDSTVNTATYYPIKILQEFAANWLDNAIWSRHRGYPPIARDITDKIGEVQNPHFDTDAVVGDIFLHGKTQKSRDTVELVKAGMANFVSVEHFGKESFNPAEGRVEAEELSFIGAAIVSKGACGVCTIENEMGFEGDVKKLADKYSKDDMTGMFDFMKENPTMVDESMKEKMYAVMEKMGQKEMMKRTLKDLKAHPEMMDDEMKGMMKGMMGGKEHSLSAEAEIMEMKELEAKYTDAEKSIKELQDASVAKDKKISELEAKLGKFKELEDRLTKIETTPVPKTEAGAGIKELEHSGLRVVVNPKTGDVYGVD